MPDGVGQTGKIIVAQLLPDPVLKGQRKRPIVNIQRTREIQEMSLAGPGNAFEGGIGPDTNSSDESMLDTQVSSNG